MHQSSGRPRPIRDWDEEDVHTGWRRMYCYLSKAGASSGVKRRTRRKERREGKREARNGMDE